MTTIFKHITGTNNLFVNSLVATVLTFIAFSLIVLIVNCAINPSLIANASF